MNETIEEKVTREDAIYYLDMTASMYSPNHVPKIGKIRPYYKLFKDIENRKDEYNRFIKVYLHVREILMERERNILDLHFGLSGELLSLSKIAKQYNLSNSRIGFLRSQGEFKIGRFLRKKYNLKKKAEVVLVTKEEERDGKPVSWSDIKEDIKRLQESFKLD